MDLLTEALRRISVKFSCLQSLSASAYKLVFTEVCVLLMKAHAVLPLSATLERQLVFPAHSSESANAQVFVWKPLLIFPNTGPRAAEAALPTYDVRRTESSDPVSNSLFFIKSLQSKALFSSRPVKHRLLPNKAQLSFCSFSKQGTTCPIEIRDVDANVSPFM